MPIYKRCSRCGKRLLSGSKCECLKARYKEYNYYRTDTKEEKFYSSKEWVSTKPVVKSKFFCIDIYSYYILNVLEYGYTTHHIIELKECWERRIDINNLIYLSESNHQIIHKAYKESEASKKAMQQLLFELVKRWEKDFVWVGGM